MSCLGTNSTKAVHSSKTANEKKRTRRHWHSHKNTTFAWCHALRRPAPVREKKRPKSDSEPALYIFRENRVLKKSVKKRFTASLQPGFCDINQLYSKQKLTYYAVSLRRKESISTLQILLFCGYRNTLRLGKFDAGITWNWSTAYSQESLGSQADGRHHRRETRATDSRLHPNSGNKKEAIIY